MLKEWEKIMWKLMGEVTFSMLARGIFVVYLYEEEDVEHILDHCPYFMGNSSHFIKKWYEGFDSRTNYITTILMWVRLFYLPQHLWNIKVVEKVGNSIGSFMKTNVNFNNKELAMMVRISVNVNLQDSLSAKIKINSKVGM